MKSLRLASLAALIAGMVIPMSAKSDPMTDICRERARSASGYSGSTTGLTRKAGNTTLRLSGSVAVGGSRSSGSQPSPNAPPFAGQASTEQREDKKKRKYKQVYEYCMRSR